ncbi:hypothetical protein [Bradyrhizobium sp. RDI18]|uniref:hypothetical protein n=1 Tax=Bradyrhizobium sp. RDI18 TaxID=3367400 RepID=UPI00371371BA
MPIAATAKAARQAEAPLCAAAPCDLKRAGEREAFIFWYLNRSCSGKGFIQKSAFRHPMKIATIRLRRNWKAKMMRPDFSLDTFRNFTSVEAAASDETKGLFK